MATIYGFDVSVSSAVDTAGGQQTADGQETTVDGPLAPEQLRQMQRYWDAANYLTVAQIYLLDNPLLREPLRQDHIKQPQLQYFDLDKAIEHCASGASILPRASSDGGGEPDVVLCAAGDIPMLERWRPRGGCGGSRRTCACAW